MLVAELEGGLLRGEQVAGSELVLQELRRTIRDSGRPAKRIGNAARLFFAPVEPFLVEDAADHRRIGRLARVSLEPIWEWISRDLMPAEAKALGEDINRALSADDGVKADQLTHALHERAIRRIKEAIAAVGGDEKARRRLSVQVGTPRALEDIGTLVRILAIRDELAEVARRLPSHLRAFEREQIDHVMALFEGLTMPRSQAPAARDADIVLFGLIQLADRLAAPWQLIRIATHAADSDAPARIAETPYAAAVNIVLGEAESMVGELRTELKMRRPVTSLLRGIHDTARGLRTEMDLSVDSPWSRQLAALRTQLSSLLKAEIESTPGRLRRLLRPRTAKEIAAGSVLDAIDVAEAEMLTEFVGACHSYASELAVNEVAVRTWSELQHYLETGTKVLLDALRHADEADRPFRQSQVDAAIRFCKAVFGADYAGLLVKAAEVAAQASAAERKPLRA